jgi:hypothetical protein
MKQAINVLFWFCIALQSAIAQFEKPVFDLSKDLLLAHYDCKTDVDDLHSVAAFATLLSTKPYAELNYYAVAGAYGIQDGLYVPPNELFVSAFGENWSDAHNDFDIALEEVYEQVRDIVEAGGNIWIAEAGQSDFSAALSKKVALHHPEIKIQDRIVLVQHSNWNQDVTNPEDLTYVRTHINYFKIPDGNATGNGTPGFKSDDAGTWQDHLSIEQQAVWKMAIRLANEYNGVDGRYLNTAIDSGGLDFSDFSEICWILGLDNIPDTNGYFELINSLSTD